MRGTCGLGFLIAAAGACSSGGHGTGDGGSGSGGGPGPMTPPMTYVDSIALDDSYVYLVTEPEPSARSIARIPKQGGDLEVLYTHIISIAYLQVVGDALFFADGDGIEMLSASGGDATAISPEKSIHSLAVDAANLYYGIDSGITQASRTPGGDPTERYRIAGSPSNPHCIAASDGTTVFVGWHTDASASNGTPEAGGIARFVAGDASAAEDLAVDPTGPIAIALDDAAVYWIDGAGNVDTLAKSTAGGGGAAPTVLAAGIGGYAIALDDEAVYVALDAYVGGGTSRVVRIAKADGAQTTIVSGPNLATDSVAVDATRVYWGDNLHGLGWAPK